MIPIGDIQLKHIKLVLDECHRTNKNFSGKRFNKVKAYVSSLFIYLVEVGAASGNMAKAISPMKEGATRPVVVSDSQKHILSKSTFIYGCQCTKRLWLHKFMPELKDEADVKQASIFQQGTDVGKLARDLFPGGVDASPVDTYSYQQSVSDTARYILEGKTVIYEAAFQYDGILCAVDIVVKKRNKWYAYEVRVLPG